MHKCGAYALTSRKLWAEVARKHQGSSLLAIGTVASPFTLIVLHFLLISVFD